MCVWNKQQYSISRSLSSVSLEWSHKKTSRYPFPFYNDIELKSIVSLKVFVVLYVIWRSWKGNEWRFSGDILYNNWNLATYNSFNPHIIIDNVLYHNYILSYHIPYYIISYVTILHCILLYRSNIIIVYNVILYYIYQCYILH